MNFIDKIKNGVRDGEKIAEEAVSKYNPIESSFCKDADRMIKELDVKIESFRRDKLKDDLYRKLRAERALPQLEDIRTDLRLRFVSKECAMKLENLKAQETAGIIGSEVQKYEDDVLSDSAKENKNLFIIGGAILLVATGTILYFTKKK